MLDRTCARCGVGVVTLRADARFCSTKCRVYAARDAKRLPARMAKARRFVRYSARKVPLTVAGRPASSTDRSTWASEVEARGSSAGVGVGYVLGAGVGCIDLDHCIVDGVVTAWARAVIDANKGTFMEVSMSGDGVHIFGLLPEGPGRVFRDGRAVEVYSRDRYIALTGNRFEFSPSALKPLVV